MTENRSKGDPSKGRYGRYEKFSVYLYILRNFQRRKLRYALTVTGVAVCVIFFIVVASLTEGVRLEVAGELEPDIRPDENTSAEERSEIMESNELNRDIERTILGWLYVTSLIIFITSVFLVGNTMMMAVLERRREVGILKSVGIAPGNIKRIFRIESLWLVTIGWLIGTIAGVHLSNNIFNYMFEAGTSTIFFGPSRTPPVVILVALFLVITVGLAAAHWPIKKAVNMSVMEAMRI